jgi:N-acetylmuramoyl-L-alanine amidase
MKLFTLILLTVLSSFTGFCQIIVIDPGHGYDANGGNPDSRTKVEITTTLAVGLKLKQLLEDSAKMWIVGITRPTTNGWVSIAQRAAMANSWNADYVLSIHCNGGGASGTETYYCEQTDSSQSDNMHFAREIQREMALHGQWRDRFTAEDKAYLKYHLGVLNRSDAVACLNEIGFADSQDKIKLMDETWRAKFANAYYQAFKKIIARPTVPKLTDTSAVKIIPNPDMRNLLIKYNWKSKEQVQILVFNKSGLIVYRGIVFGNKGEHLESINLGNIPKGVYTMELSDDSERLLARFRVE